MLCPQCLKQVQESIKQCQCGFAFDEVAFKDLLKWIDKEIEMYAFPVVEIFSGYSQAGLELCRVAVLQSQLCTQLS